MLHLVALLLEAAPAGADKAATVVEKKDDQNKEEKESQELSCIADRKPDEVLATFPGKGSIKRVDIIPHLQAIGVDTKTPRPVKMVNEMELQAAAFVAYQKYMIESAKKSGVFESKKGLIEFTTNQIAINAYLQEEAEKSITDAELAAEYKKRQDAMKDEKLFDCSVIAVKESDKAKKIVAILMKGKDPQTQEKVSNVELFKRLVQAESIEPNTKRQDGQLYPMSRKQLEQIFGPENTKKIVEKPDGQLKSGGNVLISTPLKMGDLYFIVFINSIKRFADEAKPFDEVKDQIKPLLTSALVKDKRTQLLEKMVINNAEFSLKVPGKEEFKKFSDFPPLLSLLTM